VKYALTLGGDVAVAIAESRTRLPAPRATSIADTSGAGDAFNGAYLAAPLGRAVRGGGGQIRLAGRSRVSLT